MTLQEATEIKQKAQRESILIDAVVETDAVIENGTTFYYMYKQGLPYLTIEVVEKRVITQRYQQAKAQRITLNL